MLLVGKSKKTTEQKLHLFKELRDLYSNAYNLSANAEFLCSELSLIIKTGIKRGKILSDILTEQQFDPEVVFMVKAGEKSARLTEALNHVCELYAQKIELKKKIIKAVFYPAITLFFSLTIVLAFFLLIMPRFNQIYVELGLPTSESHLLNNKIFWLIFFFGGFLLMSQKKISLKLFNRFKLVKQYFLMSFFRIFYFSLLLTVEEQRLLLAAYAENSHYQKEINMLLFYLRKGQSLALALEQIFCLKKENILRIKYGEQTGTVLAAVKELADNYHERFFLNLEKIALFFEPIMIILTGALIGGLSFSIIWPVIKLTQKFI